MRSTWARAMVIWTLALLVVAIVVAVGAVVGLVDAEQACFMGYPSVPCPDGRDWRVGLLTFVFFGIPLIWLVGVVAAIVGRVASKSRGGRRR